MLDQMLDRAGPIRDGEQLDIPKLQDYLLRHLPDAKGELTIEQFRSGYSNLTYLLKLGQLELVLRRPPFGNPVKSAHDMGREFRVLSQLCDVYGPAPRPHLFCDDPHVIGDSFYVMQRRHGVIFRGSIAPQPLAGNPQLTRDVCESLIDRLAELHALDYEAAGLGELGKPKGYVQRQVTGWSKRYDHARTDDLPAMDELASWLAENLPSTERHALIHNDYKFDNLILDPNRLTHIVAVLDWEMATVGDPLMDLGTTLAYWVESHDPAPLQAMAFGPTMIPGSLTRVQLVHAYERSTGFEVRQPLFYYVFGVFKLAVIVQQIYARFVRGHTSDARFAELDKIVACLAQTGARAIETETISGKSG